MLGTLMRDALDNLPDPHKAVAERCEMHRSDLSRFLAGKRTISDADLAVLADICGFRSRKERNILLELNRNRRQPEWWLGPSGQEVHDKAETILESLSRDVTVFAPFEIPRELHTESRPQPRFERELGNGVCRTYYIGLPALQRLKLSTKAAQEQARLLFWLTSVLTIRLVIAPEIGSPFRVLDLVESRTIVKLGNRGIGELYLESPSDVRYYKRLMGGISTMADNEDESRVRLAQIADP
ncbi:Scr1 family TA system antitoxin-like transcriptional regulator [Actinokineospora diospyrosa]|uniref:Scr1 family TA system antitoxin-like transcriptional regulator n=1 Tax=Actinokineospora diospyrosa TaxID=103728 RepID=UPI0020A57FC6|nr:Scr1 family TA system antitoxin-like transcriptional regulator [Actinokineospora diospyrosa]